jgi:hypothetical protein
MEQFGWFATGAQFERLNVDGRLKVGISLPESG